MDKVRETELKEENGRRMAYMALSDNSYEISKLTKQIKEATKEQEE